MMNKPQHILFLLGFVMLLVSCSSTKYVNDGEYLLDKVRIESDNKNYKPVDLKAYLRQQPNFKVFGLMKWQLYVYDWSGRNEKKWINKQLRRIGEAPVIMDTTLVYQSVAQLERFFVNKGYINVEVAATIDTSRRKKAEVTYHIKSNEPYRIRNYTSRLDDPKIDSIAHMKAPRRPKLASAFRPAPEGYTSLIKDSALFDRDELDKERQRITSLLRRRGYYAFNRDNLVYVADSAFNRNVVDLEMLLKPYRRVLADGSVIESPHKQYYIKDVTVVTDYNPIGISENESIFTRTDSVKVGEINVLYGKNGHSIRPSVLRKSVYLAPGQLFSERNVDQTYSSFAALRALKNVSIRFTELEEQDTMKLNCIILTSPTKSQGFGVDLEGTNSAGDFGFASSLNYLHRNLFKGSETFSTKIRGAYESLSGKKGSGLANYWELGGEASILFPRFVFPFLSENFRRKLRASTELKVSYNRQTRPEYERAILSGGWSYIWQDRSNSQARHTFKLLDIDYVYLPKIDADFKSSLPASTALYNYSDQFIVGSGYTYSFSNFTPQNRQRNTHSLRVSVELAGNLLNALSHITGEHKDSEGRYKLFGINYAQFVKGDIDFSKGIALDSRNKLAFHVGIGIAFPYGNAKMLPFERRYFSGGANSVRGWSVRELGPGSMALTDTTSFALQAGDIRLDLNLEYRTKLFWKFEMAAYVDAGNIWTIRPYKDQKEGNFDFSRFYKEIAVSYGLGLRLDFDFFLLRLDTGMKVYNPQERGSKRWAITNPNFKNNFAWHFAVGYPF
ncbi:translocation and assembly module lipoprotein TamL [Parabacteroides chinchillae]|nr:BamA/TamA family outer membrane protein [Parabacteroides chinchillae]